MRRAGALALGLATVLAAAYGITAGDSGPANRQAFFADVARRSGIDPQALTRLAPVAPSYAQRAPVDPRWFHYPGRGLSVDAASGYLGMPEWEIRHELRSGASLADVATARGKSVEGLQRAIALETQRQLAGRANLNDIQRQQLLDRVLAQLDQLVQRDGRPAGWSARGGP
jgi:hypothetical protein